MSEETKQRRSAIRNEYESSKGSKIMSLKLATKFAVVELFVFRSADRDG